VATCEPTWIMPIMIVVCLFGSYAGARSDSHPGPQDFKTKGVFELVVNDSSMLRRGPSRIVTQSAFVTRAHRLIPGNSEGLEIQFFHRADYRDSRS
jgi:hypothetical protein